MALLKDASSKTWLVRGPNSGWRSLWLAVLAMLLSGGTDASAQVMPKREYQLKAVFLFNFAQFVDWPAEAFADRNAPIIIGVLGDDPFGSVLDDVIRDEKVGQRPLLVRRFRRVEEIVQCHMLFISRSETNGIEPILSALKGRSILTVSDADGFTRQGGIIRFVSDRNKIRLKINLEVAKSCGLTISSKLLRPAEIVATNTD